MLRIQLEYPSEETDRVLPTTLTESDPSQRPSMETFCEARSGVGEGGRSVEVGEGDCGVSVGGVSVAVVLGAVVGVSVGSAEADGLQPANPITSIASVSEKIFTI